MDTTRWKAGDEFAILDLVAQFEFKTASSLSFRLCAVVRAGEPRLPEMGNEPWELLLEHGPVVIGIGWLDVHHPCEGSHRLQLRIGLPERYVSSEPLQELVRQVIVAVGLPDDESFRVELDGLSQGIMTEWPPSGFYSTSRIALEPQQDTDRPIG
jgi:hypothetical protein